MEGAGVSESAALDPQTELAYEVCIDLINEVVGVYSARLWDEQHAVRPDLDVIADLRQLISRCAQTQQDLRPRDTDEVARISQECGAVLRESAGKPGKPR